MISQESTSLLQPVFRMRRANSQRRSQRSFPARVNSGFSYSYENLQEKRERENNFIKRLTLTEGNPFFTLPETLNAATRKKCSKRSKRKSAR